MAVIRTPLTENPGGVLLAAADGLVFRLEADGPLPMFTFASSVRGLLRDAPSFGGHPRTRYEWDCSASDFQQLELLDLTLLFLTNAAYRYRVEHRRLGAADVTILDVRYSGAPTDRTSESFSVAIQ